MDHLIPSFWTFYNEQLSDECKVTSVVLKWFLKYINTVDTDSFFLNFKTGQSYVYF